MPGTRPGMTGSRLAGSDFDCLPKRLFIKLRLETYHDGAAEIEHGALDHGGLVEHERDGLALVETGLVGIRQLAEGRTRAVQKRLPADIAGPGFQTRTVDAVNLVVVEGVRHALGIEPGPRLLHRVAILDAVERRRHLLLPLDRPRRLRRDVIGDAVDALHLVDDAGRDTAEEAHVEGVEIRRHALD